MGKRRADNETEDFSGSWELNDEEIAEALRDQQLERELDTTLPYDEPLQSDLHDYMREAEQDSLTPEELSEIFDNDCDGPVDINEEVTCRFELQMTHTETAACFDGLYANGATRDWSACDWYEPSLHLVGIGNPHGDD